MKRDYILGVLFFSGLWGISEAVLGDVLYRFNVPFASVPLVIIGFVVLTFSRVFFPHKGIAALIALLAMLYKFLNVPFFACHLLGIFITGLFYDLFFSVFKIKNRSLSAAAAVYLSYTLFALMITYVFRYENWAQGGVPKILQHVLISGSMAAFGCTTLVPVSFDLAQRLKANLVRPFNLRFQLTPGGIFALTAGLWSFGLVSYIY